MNLQRAPWSLLLFSCGQMLLEVVLTRLLSDIYYPPSVFAILTLAVLGIGLGAGLASARKGLRRAELVPLTMLLASISALAIVFFCTSGASLKLPLVLFLLAGLPYFFGGLTLAIMFSVRSEQTARLYTMDLLGAGAGVVLAIPVMDQVGPISAILVAAFLIGLAALIVLEGRFRLAQAAVSALLGILLASNIAAPWLVVNPATLTTGKPIADFLGSKGRIVQTTWDSFGRTDLVVPTDGGPYRVYIDGAAGSIMPVTTGNRAPLAQDVGFFPFATEQPQRVLIIGPGGGLDVWFALQSKASTIVAVEVNPASVALVKQYGAQNGYLYEQPSVRVVVDEGRSFLRRDNAQYDLVFLSQVVTLAADRTGYALTENTIFTTDAFTDYLAHLSPGGQIALKMYDETTLTRALSTALAALQRSGLSESEALNHLAVILDQRSQPPTPLLIVSKKAFTKDDMLVYGSVARQVGLAPLYLPLVVVQPPLDTVISGKQTFAELVARSDIDISAPTDNRPFFFQFDRGIPKTMLPLVVAVLLIIGGGGAVLLTGFNSNRKARVRRLWFPLFFASIGIGYMLIEIVLIQQTRVFLGHPTLAVTTTLAVLLIGSGVGSWLAGLVRFKRAVVTPLLPAVGVVLITLAWMLAWPAVSQQFLTAPPLLRIFVTAVVLLPLAVLMGMPFPVGLRAAAGYADGMVALGWAVNGVATVIGSVGAVAIALVSGFQAGLFAGMCAYGAAAVASYLGRLRNREA
jgi:hypothetical protein